MRRLLILIAVISVLATACGDSGGSVLGSASWCDTAKEIEATNDSMDSVDIPTAEMFHTFSKQVSDAAGSAPAEIKDDVKLLAGFMNDMVKALDDNDDNILLAFDAMGDKFSDPSFDDASDRITAYNERECGIVDDSDSNTSSDTNSDSPFDSSTDSSGFGPEDDSGFPEGGLIAGLAESIGISEDQARCLVSKFDLESSTEPGLTEMMSFFSECGIDPLALGG